MFKVFVATAIDILLIFQSLLAGTITGSALYARRYLTFASACGVPTERPAGPAAAGGHLILARCLCHIPLCPDDLLGQLRGLTPSPSLLPSLPAQARFALGPRRRGGRVQHPYTFHQPKRGRRARSGASTARGNVIGRGRSFTPAARALALQVLDNTGAPAGPHDGAVPGTKSWTRFCLQDPKDKLILGAYCLLQ